MLNKINLSNWGPVTTVLAILVIIAVVGGIVCAAVGDAAFHRFVSLADALWKYAAALAGLGLGRGIHLGLTGAGQSVSDAVARSTVSGAAGAAGETVGLSEGIKAASFYDEHGDVEQDSGPDDTVVAPQLDPGQREGGQLS